MNSIVNINGAITTKTIDERLPAKSRNRSPETPGANVQADTLELSPGAARIANIEEVRNQRAQRINQIRQEIAENRYETEQRIDTTVERLFARINTLDVHA